MTNGVAIILEVGGARLLTLLIISLSRLPRFFSLCVEQQLGHLSLDTGLMSKFYRHYETLHELDTKLEAPVGIDTWCF